MSITRSKIGDGIVKPRNVKLPLNRQTVKRHWFGGDPWKTHAINALFMVIPQGERWVMQATRALMPQIRDAELAQTARDFIRQEALHSREHMQMNAVMPEHGLPSKTVEALFNAVQKRFEKHASVEFNAAMASAFEHLTAVFSDALMDAPELLETLDPEVRALTCWHVVEETEHKAVMFDILAHTVGTGPRAQALRATGMIATLSVLVPNYFLTMAYLLHKDGQLGNVRSMWACARDFYVDPGVIRKALQGTLRYLSPGFHPWDDDNRHKIKPWQERWEATQDAKEATTALIHHLRTLRAHDAQTARVVPLRHAA